MDPEQRYLDTFPYPIAYPYALVFDQNERPSIRRWALCFTQYQLLRMVCLPLVGQYLREPIDETAQKSITALNRGIAAIRSPFFSDWIALAGTLSRHLPRVGIEPLFPRLGEALKSLGKPEDRPVGLRGRTRLNPLEAILALRNATAHGGLVDEAEAARHLERYVPVLHGVLGAFAFLGEAELLVNERAGNEALATGRTSLLRLRGANIGGPVEEDLFETLIDALEESQSVLRMPGGAVVPLYPLFAPVTEQEPLYLYDGHYGIRVETRQAVQERSHIYYLGTHHRAEDTRACERLKALLARRHISFYLSKAQTAPWTIADSAADYSRRTLDDLLGQKYFPLCYVPFVDLERHFERFLRVPDADRWPAAGRARYINGLVLVGFAGAGKTAFLARQVEQLTARDDTDAQREGRDLVLFLRGNGVALRPEGMSLFRDLAEKLGIMVTPATTDTQAKPSAKAGFSTFADLLSHLHSLWKEDRIEGRRLVLVLDALNEAPFAEKVIAEALDMIDVAANYPWCKVVVSTRQEWLSLWSSKMGAQESSRLEELRPWLYVTETHRDERPSQLQGPPVVMIEPLSAEQAAEVYRRYQAAAGEPADEGGTPIPASSTRWDDLPGATHELLANPLNLHLFMEAFDGRPAEALTAVPTLYRRYVDRAMAEHPGLEGSVETVVAHLLEDLGRPSADLSDDDANALRRQWSDSLSAEESRLGLSPVEAMAHEGFIAKRVREEGGGYRFLFQAVAEYLIYRSLSKAHPSEEDELEYWSRRAQPPEVFSEFAGAFGYLLRDWAVTDKLEIVGPLAEAAADWFGSVLVEFLNEQARTGHQVGTASASAQSAARALETTGGGSAAQALFNAGLQLDRTPYEHAERVYYQTSVALSEELHAANPERADIADGLALALNNLGAALEHHTGQMVEAEGTYRRAVQIYEVFHEANPEHVDIAKHLALALNNLGRLLNRAGQVVEAEQCCRRAVRISEALREAEPEHIGIANGWTWALINLGDFLGDAGQEVEAERVYRQAVQIRETLREADPENVNIAYGLAVAQANLGNLLNRAGKTADGKRAYERAVQIHDTLREANPEDIYIAADLALTLHNFGALLNDFGQVAEAERNYRRAVQIFKALHEAIPQNLYVAGCLALTLTTLGLVLSDLGEVAEAEQNYRRAIQIRETLRESNPEDVGIADGLASALTYLGALLSTAGQVAEAEQNYRRAIQIRETLRESNPEDVGIADGLASALTYLGALLSTAGQVAEAEQNYRRAIQIREALLEANPENVVTADNLAGTLNSLGLLLNDFGQVAEAEQNYRRAIQIREALLEANPENVVTAENLAGTLNSLGLLLNDFAQVAEAEQNYRRAIQIREALLEANPENVVTADNLAGTLNSLGLLLNDFGQMAEAEQNYRRAIQIHEALLEANPEKVGIANGLALALNNLGLLLSNAGQVAEAERAYRRAVQIHDALYEANPDNVGIANGLALALNNLGLLLNVGGQVAEAERAYRRAVQIHDALYEANPENVDIADGLAMELNNLGQVLKDVGQRAAAESAVRWGAEIWETLYEANPGQIRFANSLAGALINFGAMLSDSGQVAEAEQAYRRAVEIHEALRKSNPENVDIASGLALGLTNLGNLLSNAKRVTEAERAYRRAVQVYEALRAVDPEKVGISDGLALALYNLEILMHKTGQEAEAKQAFRRVVQISETLRKANPENIDYALRYAGSLASARRFQEAEKLVEWVLERVPQHSYATKLRDHIARAQQGKLAYSRTQMKRFLGWGG